MEYREPNIVEKIFNKIVGLVAGSRFSPGDLYLLIFLGRKTGKQFSTPVFMMLYENTNYLVAPRGETQWVRNVRQSNTLTLKRGKNVQLYQAVEMDSQIRAKIIKEYLERYTLSVATYFPIKAGSDIIEFEKISKNYPVFEIHEN